MKKLFFISIALFYCNANAQNLIVGENTIEGAFAYSSSPVGTFLKNPYPICVEINFKTENVEITNFGEVRNYHINKVEIDKDPEYINVFCSNTKDGDIKIFTTGLNISVNYGDVMYFAELPEDVRRKNMEPILKEVAEEKSKEKM